MTYALLGAHFNVYSQFPFLDIYSPFTSVVWENAATPFKFFGVNLSFNSLKFDMEVFLPLTSLLCTFCTFLGGNLVTKNS